MKILRCAVLALALAVAALASASAQSVSQFYSGKQLTMLIGFGAGGGYDAWARTVARHMGKHIPGNPTFVPQNIPGAGSIVAANHLYGVAPKDGTVVGIIARDAPLAPLTGNDNAKFDALKFTWLDSPTAETNVCIAHRNSGIRTFADLQ